MKYLIYILPFVFFSQLNAQSYDLGQEEIRTHCPLYNQAYQEIADMLDGKIDLSIKRAVFLTEWALLPGWYTP